MVKSAFSSVVRNLFSFASQIEVRGGGASASCAAPWFQREQHSPTENWFIGRNSTSEELWFAPYQDKEASQLIKQQQ